MLRSSGFDLFIIFFCFIDTNNPEIIQFLVHCRLGAFSPAGALCLSPTDLTKWLYFLNHYGTTPSQNRLINSLVFAKMISSKVSLDFMTQLSLGLFSKFPAPSYISWYALGWFGRFYRGQFKLPCNYMHTESADFPFIYMFHHSSYD